MNARLRLAVAIGIVAVISVIATIAAITPFSSESSDDNMNSNATGQTQGKNIVINLNENVELKENP